MDCLLDTYTDLLAKVLGTLVAALVETGDWLGAAAIIGALVAPFLILLAFSTTARPHGSSSVKHLKGNRRFRKGGTSSATERGLHQKHF